MAGNNAEIEHGGTAEVGADDPGPNYDWFLVNFLDHLNINGGEIGITLQVGGLVVSGYMIGGKEYFDKFADEVVIGMGDYEEKEKIRNSYRQFRSIYENLAQMEDPPLPTFIHLKEVRLFAPGQRGLPTNKPVLWRGRVSAIDAFWMGVLAIPDKSSSS